MTTFWKGFLVWCSKAKVTPKQAEQLAQLKFPCC